MTKAFTLIEVLVSVIILSYVGVGLLQISSNNKHNFIYLREKSHYDRLASIAFIHNSPKYNHKTMNLYDYIRDDYTNIDDELRKYLKNIKVTYEEKEISTFKPLEEDKEDISSDFQENNGKMQSALNLTINYDKITVSKEKSSTYVYKIYIPMAEK